MSYDFDWGMVAQFLPKFSTAVWVTIKVYLMAQVLSLTTAFLLSILGNSGAGGRVAERFLSGYSWMFRGLPELIVLLFCFLGLPQIGLRLSSIEAAVIGLALVASAYEYEILRGAFTAIPAQQYEAARALGFTVPKMYRRLILPQVIRVATPSLLTFACTSLKRTSVASAVAVVEIMGLTKRLIDALQKPFELMLIAMLLYAALSSTIMLLQFFARRHLEAYSRT